MRWLVVVAFVAPVFTGLNLAQAGPSIRLVASEHSTITADTVKSIRADGNGLLVVFVKTAGTYYLDRDVINFETYRKKLEESLKHQKPVSVKAEQHQLNIVEVK
ncbi:hypothetical protein [Bdellovibrio bacteriovorus]|uniref:hypothetical protein n=1 Tax=Bdellovibrio bacteriovorus TaxID=959 RepID=UPI0002DCCAAA|nr:hypothetical protein [Bdellovibrio bacteriovorus]